MEAIINIEEHDSGINSDSEILSRLFTKFASMPSRGTDLRLYLSKTFMMERNGPKTTRRRKA